MGIYLRLVRFAAPYEMRIALAILCMVVLSLAEGEEAGEARAAAAHA